MNQEDLYWFSFILVTIVGFFMYKLLTSNRSYFRLLGVPYEKPHLIYGNLSDVLSGKLTMMEKLEQYYEKYSDHDFFGFFNYMTPALYVRDPRLIGQIEHNRNNLASHGYFLDESKDRFLGNQLHLVKSPEKAHRLSFFLQSSFKKNESLSGLQGMLKGKSTEMNEFIASRADLELEMRAICFKHLLNVFAGCAFEKELNIFEDESDRFCTIASGLAYGTNPIQVLKTVGFYLTPRLMRLLKVQFSDAQEVDYLVRQFQAAASQPDGKSLARLLRQENGKLTPDSEKWLTDDQLTAHCATVFTKGFEPTLTLLSFAIYELAQNAQVQMKLFEEVYESETASKDVSFEDIRSLPYLDAVVKETLRKWPPQPLVVRECTKPCRIQPSANGDGPSIPLKVGDKVHLSVWALHRNADYFPQPDQFQPERFIGRVGSNEGRLSPNNTYIPFGIGRGCLGDKLVSAIVKISLVTLVQRFILKPGERTAEPLKLIETGSSFEARDGLWIRFEPRLK